MKIRLTQNVPRYARLTEGTIVDAEPIVSHPEVMQVKGFGAFENGALVRGWELILGRKPGVTYWSSFFRLSSR